MKRRHSAVEVLPESVAVAVNSARYWFVIGGHAVRCFCPYRPSRDVDFGVISVRNARELIQHLRSTGRVEILERMEDTTHLTFEGIDVSIFVLPKLAKHVEDHVLTVDGILATKLHAILDRGTRRDFFDLYVMMETHRLGIVDCLRAIRAVYEAEVNDGLILRALTYFDDAAREAALPGEGAADWQTVQAFFTASAGALLLPPLRPLSIQGRTVDVVSLPAPARRRTTARRPTRRRAR